MNSEKSFGCLYLLTGAVLLLGTVLVVIGTRSSAVEGGQVPQSGCAVEVCQPSANPSALVERGAILEGRECAGCHAGDRRVVGPSYAVIAARYHCRPAELSTAIGHPASGWADYPRGPAGPSLAAKDRVALAAWILEGNRTR